MSVIYENEVGYLVSHADFIQKVYNEVKIGDNLKSFQMIDDLFNIKCPYTKTKSRNSLKRKVENGVNNIFDAEVDHVKNLYVLFYNDLIKYKLISTKTENCDKTENREALKAARDVYANSGQSDVEGIIGENTSAALSIEIRNTRYLFPKQCKFYCSHISNISKHLEDKKFDLILLDPPWWNKYIRRKKLKTNDSYSMMYNDELKMLPIENLITKNGVVVVWCTNSISHLNYMKSEIFKKWNVEYIKKWYWIKITNAGEPVCNFSEPPGKQPFEQIIFASKSIELYTDLPDRKIIVSIPSALHSHKPPLYEILQKFIPENANCLEIFARYLLPNWTSYGLEAIRFQHCSLYRETTIIT